MGDVVNLNKVRKARDKAEARRSAQTNRTSHGMTKAEKSALAAERDRAKRLIEGHRLDETD